MAEEIIETSVSQYPHITADMAKTLEEIGATPQQWQSSDANAKKHIDTNLSKYQTKKPRCNIMVIGTSGSGKSATANTLLGKKSFKEGSSAVPVTTYPKSASAMLSGLELVVVDTPGSWEVKIPADHTDPIHCYVIVINLASPRFDSSTLNELRALTGIDGKAIITSGQFVVVLTHADSALQQGSLMEYITEIKGDPLHTFLTKDAMEKYLALNNAAGTEYEREGHRWAVLTKMLAALLGSASEMPFIWQLIFYPIYCGWQIFKSVISLGSSIASHVIPRSLTHKFLRKDL